MSLTNGLEKVFGW